MDLEGRVVVVTGGGNGIGAALSQRFAAGGAAHVAVADRDGAAAESVAAAIRDAGGRASASTVDVSVESQVVDLVRATEDAAGPIDLFCSNAGIGVGEGPETPDDVWQRIWDVNLMAHVYAARAVLPGMLARGEGYLLNTASAAGLLTQIGSAPYAVTKHAAVAFAEWLSVTYGDRGIRVSCLCPQGVRTQMLLGGDLDSAATATVVGAGAVLEPEAVAEAVVEALAAERFLVLPHPEVLTYFQRKANDYDRWLSGMRRLQARVTGG